MADQFDPSSPGADFDRFMAESHLATLTTSRHLGDLQVTPVGFTYDPDLLRGRIITWADSVKARRIAANPGMAVAVCQVDRGRWLTFYGTATVRSDSDEVGEAVARYSARYRPPKERSDRVVIAVSVERIIGRVG